MDGWMDGWQSSVLINLMQMEIFFLIKKTHLASVYGDCNE